MSGIHKLLFVLSALLLAAALILKRVSLSDRIAMIVGLAELMAAAAIGIAFGLAHREKVNEESDQSSSMKSVSSSLSK